MIPLSSQETAGLGGFGGEGKGKAQGWCAGARFPMAGYGVF